MKSKLTFLLLAVLFFAGCSGHESLRLNGAWRWITIKYMSGDTLKWIKTASPEESGIKMWSDDHFVCVYRFKSDTAFEYSYSGGSYKLDGNRYEETVLYHDMINVPDLVGLKVMMRLELINDTLTQTYPVDENGELLKHYTITEKLVRLDTVK